MWWPLFRRALFGLLLPTLLLIGGWIYFGQNAPKNSFVFSPPTPPKAMSYDREGVKKELFFPQGDRLDILCEKALLKSGQEGWSESWGEVTGTWITPDGIHRSFKAKEAEFFFSLHLLKAGDLELREEGLIELSANEGEFIFSSTPLCHLIGEVKGRGDLKGEIFFLETPSLLYKEGKVLTSSGGLLTSSTGWEIPFTGSLTFDGTNLEISEGEIRCESEFMALQGHSLKAELVAGAFSDITIGKGVAIYHRLARNADPFQEAVADQLNLHLNERAGVITGTENERVFFVDKTHRVEMEVEALHFRWDETGEIEGIEGKGEMTLSTSKEDQAL